MLYLFKFIPPVYQSKGIDSLLAGANVFHNLRSLARRSQVVIERGFRVLYSSAIFFNGSVHRILGRPDFLLKLRPSHILYTVNAILTNIN